MCLPETRSMDFCRTASDASDSSVVRACGNMACPKRASCTFGLWWAAEDMVQNDHILRSSFSVTWLNDIISGHSPRFSIPLSKVNTSQEQIFLLMAWSISSTRPWRFSKDSNWASKSVPSLIDFTSSTKI